MSTTSPLASPAAATPTTSSISSLLNRTKSNERPFIDNSSNARSSDNDTLSISTHDDGAVWPAHLPTPVSPAAPPTSQSHSQSSYPATTTLPGTSKQTHDGGLYTSFSLNKQTSKRRASPSITKPYTCTQCDQTFSRAHNLKSHFATHSMERPYKCDTCDAKFRRLHDLKRHQKLHTGERPYVCHVCARSFSRLDALNRHQRTENGSACNYRQNRRQKEPEEIERHTTRPPIPQLDLRHHHLHSQQAPQQHTPPPQQESTPSSSTTSPSHHRIVLPPPPAEYSSYPRHGNLPDPLRRSSADESDSLRSAYSKLSAQYRHMEMALSNKYQQKSDEAEELKRKLHDLQVENRVLRSLVFEQRQKDPEALSPEPPSVKNE